MATVVASICAIFLFRRHMPTARLAVWAVSGLIAATALVTVVVALGFGELLYHRLAGGASGGDLAGTSSGRTEIWANALEVMFDEPLSLLTGYGWRAYQSMPFRYAPHNYYLNQWFNLGLPGLICSVLLLALPIRMARSVIDAAPANLRPILMGFVIGTIAFATATFFVDIYLPWLYYWAYAGIVMRLAVNLREQSTQQVQIIAPLPSQATTGDSFGWRGAMRH